jgi:hypothetical protein
MVRLRLALFASLLLVGSAMSGCRDTKPDYFGTPPAPESTGGRTGTGTGGRPATGGRGGTSGAADAGAVKPVDAVPAVDGAVAGPDAVASDAVASDAVPVVEVGAPDMVVVPVADAAAPDTRPVTGNGPAACFPDPKVIAICLQLEAACNNCPGGGMGMKPTMDCYAVVQRGNDVACAKYAVDKKCTIDPGGNVCGSLNCGVGSGPPVKAGCNRNACRTAQGNGDSAKCQALLAACPCS